MSNEFVNELPPQNIDAEKAVLGSIFLSTDALVESMEFLESDDFYKHSHQIIYKDMVELTTAMKRSML